MDNLNYQENLNFRIKIFKSANKMSILDVISVLDYHKQNRKNELEYKGNIMFLINEYGASGNIADAYLSKAAAKYLFNSIVNNQFDMFFPKGFTEFGGTVKGQNVRSRILSIKRNQKNANSFDFNISEGQGALGDNGSITMVKMEKQVRKTVSMDEIQKMAHEVLSFISIAEIVSYLKGKPYFTILPERNSNQSGTPVEAEYHSFTQDNSTEHINNEAGFENQVETKPYIINIGNWSGTPITDIDSEILEMIIAKVNPDTPERAELIEEAKKELNKRY